MNAELFNLFSRPTNLAFEKREGERRGGEKTGYIICFNVTRVPGKRMLYHAQARLCYSFIRTLQRLIRYNLPLPVEKFLKIYSKGLKVLS
jgi:hypothetical protein